MNSSKHYKVYTIVVTYNGERWVRPCLDSLKKSTYPTKVIVVDNASRDRSVNIIRESYPEVTLIENKKNSGFGDANNIGMKVALREGADFIFLLNQDAWIEHDTMSSLVQAATNFPEYDVISPLHYNGAGSALDVAFQNYLRQGGYSLPAIQSEHTTVEPIEFINAAAWLMRRRCLEVVGGFAPIFVHYGEDRDYVQRLMFHNTKLGWTAVTRIFHDRAGRTFDFSNNAKFIWYYYTGSVVRLADVNYSFMTVMVKVAAWCFGDCLKFLLKGRLYSPVAFAKVFLQTGRKMREIRRYREILKSKKKFLFLEDQ